MASIAVLTGEQQASARKAGAILKDCLVMLKEQVRPGITTAELDQLAEAFIRSRGAEPAFQKVPHYSWTLCTSVNDECVHGIPGDRVLQEGDIIATDCGVYLDGIYTDACRTYPVGQISAEAQRLLDTSEHALKKAVSMIKAGVQTGDISALIQRTIEDAGFKAVRTLTGHGLGTELHMYPDIPNVGEADTGPELPAGCLIAIEPIVSAGSDSVRESPDHWTLIITDGALSAHFEHTILVGENSCEVLA